METRFGGFPKVAEWQLLLVLQARPVDEFWFVRLWLERSWTVDTFEICCAADKGEQEVAASVQVPLIVEPEIPVVEIAGFAVIDLAVDPALSFLAELKSDHAEAAEHWLVAQCRVRVMDIQLVFPRGFDSDNSTNPFPLVLFDAYFAVFADGCPVDALDRRWREWRIGGSWVAKGC